jgi:phasin family protein
MADVETATPVAAKKFEKVAEITTARAAETIKQTTESATAHMKTMQAEVTGGLKQAAEMARTYVDVQRTALETVAKAGQIYGEGLKSLATHAVDVNRTQFEQTVAHFRALAGVKSITEAMSLQAQFARATASRALSESSAFVEDYLKVTGDALAPVTARVREAAEKVKQAA